MMVILSHILVKSTINDLNPPLDPLNFGNYRLNETLTWDNITFIFEPLMIKLIWKCYLKYRSTRLLNWSITVLVTTCTLKVGIEDDSGADSSDFSFLFFPYLLLLELPGLWPVSGTKDFSSASSSVVRFSFCINKHHLG